MPSRLLDDKIRQVSQGDLGNFHELYRRYAGPVRGVLYRLAPQGTLEDLVQETFLKIWKGLPKFDGRSDLKIWIFRIAHRVAIDAYRRSKPEIMGADGLEPSVKSEEGRVLHENLVRKLLSQFSIEHRSVLVLFFIEEFSLQEIAAIEEVPIGTVKSRLHYAKRKFQDDLQREGAL